MLGTQVLLAQSLGVSSRGAVAAATAPLMLAVACLTLGLPEALTYLVARSGGGRRHRRQLGISLVALLLTGSIGTLVILNSARPLSGGSAQAADLMVVASFALVPGLFTGVLRGVALGMQSWWLVTGERTLSAAIQLITVGILVAFGSLTPMSATLAIASTTFIGAAVYLTSPQWWSALRRSSEPSMSQESAASGSLSALASFAWPMWIGALAGTIAVKLDQVLIAPLAGVDELAIYVVALNVSNVALLFNAAVGQVLLAVEAGTPNNARIGSAARATVIVTTLVTAAIVAVSPWAIPILFGHEFARAVPVVAVLGIGYSLGIAGSVAGAALMARGRPGLRSVAILISNVFYITGMFALVPRFGALGAAFSMSAGSLVGGSTAIFLVNRYCDVPLSEFFRFRASDLNTFRVVFRWLKRLY